MNSRGALKVAASVAPPPRPTRVFHHVASTSTYHAMHSGETVQRREVGGCAVPARHDAGTLRACLVKVPIVQKASCSTIPLQSDHLLTMTVLVVPYFWVQTRIHSKQPSLTDRETHHPSGRASSHEKTRRARSLFCSLSSRRVRPRFFIVHRAVASTSGILDF